MQENCPSTSNGTNPVDYMNPAIEIERLQREIAELQRAERGNVAPPPMLKDFSIQEQPSSSSKERRLVTKKVLSMTIGAIIVAGIVLGIMTLSDFMKSNDIQFSQDAPGNAPITMSELALHNSPDDCWVLFYGNVYDMSNYARRHPGGAKIITNLAGLDGTVEYERFHSESLLRSVQGDRVGILVEEEGGTNQVASTSTNVGGNSDSAMVTMEELASHNTATDCWVGLYGNVYDLTDYAKKHPGGARIVTNLAGSDGTSEYQRFHSQGLLNSVQKTLIGRLEGYQGGTNGNDQGTNELSDSSDD